MIDKLKRKWYLLCAEWKYRKQNYNEVCCCGDSFGTVHYWSHDADNNTHSEEVRCLDICCPSRCAKEYAVTSYVENKMKGRKGE